MQTAIKLIAKKVFSLKNVTRSKWRESAIKSAGIMLFLAATVILIYLALWEGMHFIVSLGGLGTIIIKKIIFILFFILFFMVAVSFGALFYGISFRHKETEFLLTLPVEQEGIITYRFLEAFALAAWIPLAGILFFITAYAFVGNIGVGLPLISSLYAIPFLFITCFFGGLAALLVVRFFNLKKFFIFMAVALIAGFFIYSRFSKPPEEKNLFYFISEDVAFFRLAKTWFMPFAWPGYGLTYFEDRSFGKSFVYLACLWSLAGVCLSYLTSLRRIFMDIHERKFSQAYKKFTRKDYISKIISCIKIMPRYMRSFMIKDIRLFFREPGLWIQLLIYFGILFFYFLNFRRLSYHNLEGMWKNILTFLNTFSILSIVSGMSIRFVFPQWSMEGRNFWILRLSPLSLARIFWEKFIISFLVLFVMAESLVYLSNYMLQLEKTFFMLTLSITSIASFTLIILSLGLGAYFADFKEESYLKAVESLGGFIALVVNVGYIFITIFIFASITHFYFIGKLPDLPAILPNVLLCWGIFSLTGAFLTGWIGIRKLKNKEY